MTVSDRIGRGKAPDLAWGSPSEAGQACLESSPGMPRDTLARVARDSGEVSSRTARPKNHTSHTTDAHKIVSESARLFGEAPQLTEQHDPHAPLRPPGRGGCARSPDGGPRRRPSLPLKKFTRNRNTSGARGPAVPSGLPEAARAPCGPARPHRHAIYTHK